MTKSRSRKFADIMGGTFSSMIEDGTIDPSDITGLHTVATSGSFDDLSDKPAPFDPSTLATVSTTGSFNDLSDKPAPFDPNTLATVATTGSYTDLSGTPTLGTAAATASTDYATSAQGALADTALQPTDTATNLTINTLTIGSSAKINFQNNDSISYNDGDSVGAFSFNADGGTNNARVRAGTFYGSGAGLTNVGSTSAGAVGTYAFLIRKTSGSSLAAGSTYAGSGLAYSGVRVGLNAWHEVYSPGSVGSTRGGTWRCMGTTNNNSGIYPVNIFVRIS